MHAIIFKTLFTLLSLTLFHGPSVFAAPLPPNHSSSSQVEQSSNLSERTTASTGTSHPGTFIAKAPHWVIYSDADPGTQRAVPTSAQLKGYNVFILAFYLTSGPSDQLEAFVNSPNRKAIIEDLHNNGISLMMSVLGSTEQPTTDKKDPKSFAHEVASFVKKYGLDGVDVDYEDFPAMDSKTGSAEKWLVTFTQTLRSQLPQGQYIITHAPVAPWFGTDKDTYPHGAYRNVHENAGSDIDWYNIQYYNQGDAYSTCSQIVTKSPSSFPNTAIKQINKVTGVPFEKLVIGKPAEASQADNGPFMSHSTLATCLQDAQELGWNAGTMHWEYSGPKASLNLISTVRSLAFPLNLGL